MSALDEVVSRDERQHVRVRIRARAFLLGSLALAFYFGFIALTIYRSHH